MDTFSERLRAARLAVGHTQESISELMGMDRTNYVKYERGKKLPDYKTVIRIAKALNISPSELFSWIVDELESI